MFIDKISSSKYLQLCWNNFLNPKEPLEKRLGYLNDFGNAYLFLERAKLDQEQWSNDASLTPTVYSPSLSTIHNTISEQEKNNLDFDDGLVIACMKKLNIQGIVTFDSHFESVEGINILSPSKALADLRNSSQLKGFSLEEYFLFLGC